MEKDLRKEANRLLEEGTVDYIIGHTQGSLKYTTTPLITRDKNETSRLIISPFMHNNLANYLIRLHGKAGIVAKGCDSRSIVSLIQDKQVSRENVFIIGVPCCGLVDMAKLESLTGKERDQIEAVTLSDGKVSVKIGGKKKEYPASQVLFDHCLSCEFPTPQEYDCLIGEPVAASCDTELSNKKITDIKKLSAEARWAFWKKQFSRCIRCYACREVCPACFCERCFVEESQPHWISPVPQWQDNLVFQAIRTIHVAGRCTDCGECERVCPQRIPLRLLSREMYDLTDEMFHYKSGIDKDAPSLMTAYEMVEAEGLIR